MQLAPFKSLFNVFIFFVSTNVPSLPVQGCLCWAYTGCKILITLYVWMNNYYTCFWIIIHYMVIWPYISHFNLFIFLSLFLPVFWREKSPRNSFLPLLAITAVTIELKECIYLRSGFEQMLQLLKVSTLLISSICSPTLGRKEIACEKSYQRPKLACEGLFRASHPSSISFSEPFNCESLCLCWFCWKSFTLSIVFVLVGYIAHLGLVELFVWSLEQLGSDSAILGVENNFWDFGWKLC